MALSREMLLQMHEACHRAMDACVHDGESPGRFDELIQALDQELAESQTPAPEPAPYRRLRIVLQMQVTRWHNCIIEVPAMTTGHELRKIMHDLYNQVSAEKFETDDPINWTAGPHVILGDPATLYPDAVKLPVYHMVKDEDDDDQAYYGEEVTA